MARLTALAAVALVVAAPSGASAAQVIGQNGTPGICASNESYVQAAESGSPRYTPAANGVITSWSAMSDGLGTHTLALLVMKPDPRSGPYSFIAVQRDSVRSFSEAGLNTFTGVHLPIKAGERLGLYVPAGQLGMCDIPSASATGNQLRWYWPGEAPFRTSVAFPVGNSLRLNASAVVEPDCDKDGLGDESQDPKVNRRRKSCRRTDRSWLAS